MKVRDLTVGQLVDILSNNPELIDERFAPYCCELQDGRIDIDGILDLDKDVVYEWDQSCRNAKELLK